MNCKSSSKTIIDELSDTELKRLYSYGKRLAERHPSSQLQGEEILHIAIEQTLSLRRQWNPKKCPLLYVHLAGCMKSIVFNASIRIKEVSYMGDEGYEGTLSSDSMSYETAESIFLLQEHINGFINFVEQNTPELISLATAIIKEEISKNQELEEYLKQDISMINNKKKRLKRLYQKYMQEI